MILMILIPIRWEQACAGFPGGLAPPSFALEVSERWFAL